MLGSQDFCGYYDWTFRYVAEKFGQTAVEKLWADAIGGESQSHYLQAAISDGLSGLYRTWVKTGQDEQCDWTFTLDKSRNILRWDMRRCPSKGFLLRNNLNAYDDYCDHCMGWLIPLLKQAGIEVIAHEHNHCGQCWAEMSIRGRPYQPLEIPCDIRKDPSWKYGYVDRWNHNEKTACPADATQIQAIFRNCRDLCFVTTLENAPVESPLEGTGVVLSGRAYLGWPYRAHAILIDDAPSNLHQIAERYLATPDGDRPALLYDYVPTAVTVDFSAEGLPRPLPLLPLLIDRNLYRHDPRAKAPSTRQLMSMLARALAMPARLDGELIGNYAEELH